jgi:hypothetical protein
MNAITRGQTIKVTTPKQDRYTPESSEQAIVKSVFKNGNIKVVSEYGYGYIITNSFFSGGGVVEVVE